LTDSSAFAEDVMQLRLLQLALACLLCLVCHGMTCGEQRTDRAEELWQAGQAAMKSGEPECAITLYEQSLEADPQLRQNHLSLAAAYLEKGNDRLACDHLGKFLATNPDHRNARFYYAELLVKLGRHREASGHLELAVRREQEEPQPDLQHLVHCHTRLLEVSEALNARYLVHLHRGIGMYLLARQRIVLPDVVGQLPAEALLCKAVAELTRAHSLRPGEARACWYLHAAWKQLAQAEPARRWLAEASRLAPFTDLTPAEARDLWLACRATLDAVPRGAL
jgi:tetratricopeptide (TPR) repeat protein